ncbi:DUF697 domain-containing protein [Leptolyngbya sp. FACHB-671]|uniref:slr1306 family protein n=1 Tax=Leptolyngbya sp. FACHB-671 TaxID=2692812 RepID=UPI0016834808|nr:DUF697 domain-containing protein [Leptolyngbya sp. FACHB-671]MBD2071015.1 DUF697 domain-containing protein [Leptolyngbya sp. FACHB-671]
MDFKLRKPILVGGLGLTAGVWLLHGLNPGVADFSGTAIWGALTVSSGFWWLRKRSIKPLDLTVPAIPVDRTAVEKALSAVETLVKQLAAETNTGTQTAALTSFQEKLTQLTAELERNEIRLAIAGGQSVGKTALTQYLTENWVPQSQKISISDTVGLFAEPGEAGETLAPEVDSADLVLFITASDLTSPEYQTIQQLLTRQQRVLLLFNKQDQYLPDERPLVLQQIRARVQGQLATEDVMAIATAPAPVKVRQYQSGSVQERLEQPAADVAGLSDRLTQVLAEEGQRLILSTVLRQVNLLRLDVQNALNQVRRDRALPLIEQSQWIAAAAAFANPVPSLDLLATAAVNTQLIVDLGEIYQQKFSLQQAKTATGTLADLMVKLGLVELSAQAISPLLKSHAVTFVAGGLMEGLSAAYLTRLAGLSLIEYFQEQSYVLDPNAAPFQVDRLTQKLKAVFQDNQRTAFLQALVQQGISRLAPAPTPVLPGSAAK